MKTTGFLVSDTILPMSPGLILHWSFAFYLSYTLLFMVTVWVTVVPFIVYLSLCVSGMIMCDRKLKNSEENKNASYK